VLAVFNDFKSLICGGQIAIVIRSKCDLTVRLCMGGLSARPVETLLISRRVSAGKFCTCTTLLWYLLSAKWSKNQYTNLINEFLAIFYCTYPIKNAVWMLISRIEQLLQRQRLTCATLTNSPSGRLMSACGQHPAIDNPYWWKSLCREISVGRLQNYLASEQVSVAEMWPACCESAV